MLIRMDELVRAIAVAFEIVEGELLGATSNHGKRIAVLCSLMGRKLGMNDAEILALTTCALFHDNALTEYILSEQVHAGQELNMRLHCEYGQRNIETLPFDADVTGLVLYHHELADGSGPFGKKEGEYPLGAELIAIADMVDVIYKLELAQAGDLPAIWDDIKSQTGKLYTKRAVDAMLAILDEAALESLKGGNVDRAASNLIPVWEVDVQGEAIINLAELVAQIIDYKSTYTKNHSIEIAKKVWIMCDYYGIDASTRAKAYLAAALHDIGKLAVPTQILEKPGKLTDEEFATIKAHTNLTYELLSGITGFDDICNWASNHHEKLDGSGYPRGKDAAELDHISRLLTCVDIYQAVSEKRPYHPARSHDETMAILREVAEKGQIDGDIVNDLDEVFGKGKAVKNANI